MLKYFNLKNLFLIGFVGGFLISLLKLSNLSMPYGIKMYLVIFAAVFSFILGYYSIGTDPALNRSISKVNQVSRTKNKKMSGAEFSTCLINKSIIIIIIFSLVAFIIEATILGYVPILKIGTPHAYSEFHIFGLHYITTAFVLIPMLSVISFISTPKANCPLGKKSLKMCRIVPVIGFFYSIIMPIILVSRFQLIYGLTMGVFVFIILLANKIECCGISNKFNSKASNKIHSVNNKHKNDSINAHGIFLKMIFGILIFITIYVIITIARSHSVKYLNEIFDMKDKNTPIFITQPYMYIAHNFENLNYLIMEMPFFTYGRRMLQPLFALTLTKKFFPHITTAPPFLIKEELSTGTLIYDFYFDFGILGVIIFMFIIGYCMRKLDEKMISIIMTNEKVANRNLLIENTIKNKIVKRNNMIIDFPNKILFLLLFGQNAFYMLFSFFQSFYSLTSTWIYFLFSILITFIISTWTHRGAKVSARNN